LLYRTAIHFSSRVEPPIQPGRAVESLWRKRRSTYAGRCERLSLSSPKEERVGVGALLENGINLRRDLSMHFTSWRVKSPDLSGHDSSPQSLSSPGEEREDTCGNPR